MTTEQEATEQRAGLPGGRHPARRGGRRPGESTTRVEILRAARQHFASQGFAGTTVRAVAAAAGVNQALVYHFFGSKDGLYAASLALPTIDIEAVRSGLLDGLGHGDVGDVARRLTRFALAQWEDPVSGQALRAMVRGSATSELAAEHLRVWLQSALITGLAQVVSPDAVEERVAMITSHLFGVAVARYVVEVPALARLDLDEVVTWASPPVHAYLAATGPDDLRPPAGPAL